MDLENYPVHGLSSSHLSFHGGLEEKKLANLLSAYCEVAVVLAC